MLDKTANRYVRRCRYHDMHMVYRYMSPQNVHILLTAVLPHYLSDTISYLSLENFFPVLRHPHYVQMNRIHRMRTMSVFSVHAAYFNLLKLSA
uniref:Uncharacterized protein n=1 Tax=Candidatus Kentrum eta TaxID=2126337 RepID=A0A450VCN5_9GAMM|nr:MAG: hypothetical protein BECKH772A_GA0070896_100974 [Candidatus Kentron sp. H]VFJ96798.1 MAG: hypothetical protein BECKH772B_GA0070898_100984 [Candidatus Kentron sp. H]VFK02559.1 MAG: hypothetical protein BECKH772C_GA0070978_100947 [Candidatus Kentron sp. H]